MPIARASVAWVSCSGSRNSLSKIRPGCIVTRRLGNMAVHHARKAVEHVKQVHNELVKAVAAFPDSRLQEQVPGKSEDYYNFYYMFSGIVQHELYHAGQIALLKKAR